MHGLGQVTTVVDGSAKLYFLVCWSGPHFQTPALPTSGKPSTFQYTPLSLSSELLPPFCHGTANLPAPSTIVEPNFIWGSTDSTSVINSLNVVYESVVHWKPNLFRIPYGNVGKLFVSELARLYNGFATSSSLEAIAMKAVTVMPILLLQKPNSKSKTK